MDDNHARAVPAARGAALPAPRVPLETGAALMPDIINAHGFRVATSPAYRRRKRARALAPAYCTLTITG